MQVKIIPVSHLLSRRLRFGLLLQISIKSLKPHLDILPKQPRLQKERRESREGFKVLERRAAGRDLALFEGKGVQPRDASDRRTAPLECCSGVFLGKSSG